MIFGRQNTAGGGHKNQNRPAGHACGPVDLFLCILYVLLGVDVDDASGGDAELGDDGQGHEAERHERVDAPADAEREGCVLGCLKLVVDLGQRTVGHDARDLQHDRTLYRSVFDHDDAAVVLDDVIRGERHIGGVRADDDDVVRVMRNAGRDRAGFQAVALNVAEADVMRALVALDNGDLQNVLFQIDVVGIAVVGRDDLARDHAQNASLARVAEIVGRERRDVEGVVGALVEIFLDLRRFKVAQLAVVPVQNALLEDHFDVEVLEIVDHGEVGQIAGRDRAAVIEQEIARGVVAGGLDGMQ